MLADAKKNLAEEEEKKQAQPMLPGLDNYDNDGRKLSNDITLPRDNQIKEQ